MLVISITKEPGDHLVLTIPPSAVPQTVRIHLADSRHNGPKARIGIDAERTIHVDRALAVAKRIAS